jgi:hypothetical protein
MATTDRLEVRPVDGAHARLDGRSAGWAGVEPRARQPATLDHSKERRMKTMIPLLAAAMLFATAAAAQDEGVNVEGGVSYQRKTVINFEDDTIEGDLKTPDGQYLTVKKKLRHKSLIRIRKDFRREVLSSVGDL